jgi:hypothetical protein
MNRHLVGRRLSEAIHGGQLPASVSAAATALLAKVDAGDSITGLPAALVNAAWSSTAREVASGAAKVAQLRAVAELEASLGSAPVAAIEAASEEASEAPAKTDDVTSSDVAESIASTPAWSGR